MAAASSWRIDYDAEIMRRIERLNDIKTDPLKWAVLKEHYSKFEAQSCIDFINHWCVTFDPRARPPMLKLMPFKLFPRQEDFVHFVIGCLRDREDGLVEKSRDMGATWVCCAISVWLWLFHSGSTVGWGSNLSHNIDDRGNPKAIFLKIRQIIDNLPSIMKPAGFDPRWHTPSMKILHPTDTATIIGEGGDNVGRGGRTTIYFKDESAHYERPELIEASLGDNTDVQIDMSSVNGSNNVFYRRRMAGEVWHRDKPSTPGKVRVFIFDWSDNPFKTQEWHDKREEKARREGLLHIFRQEVERDYAGSVDRVIIQQEWVRASVDAHIVLGISDDGEKIGGQDIADGGGDKNAICIRHGIVMRHCDHWGGEADEAPKITIPACVQYGVRELMYDSIGVGTGFKAGIKQMAQIGTLPKQLKVVPWNAGAAVLDPEKRIIPNDKESPKNVDQYLNLKAQAWFRLRSRFYKTYRAVKHGEKFDHAELISLDSTMEHIQELMMQFSQATYDANSKGKTIVDKTPDGASSPNLADAVVMCYCPIRQPMGFFSDEWKV